MSKLENIISESINEAVKETIAEMDIDSIVEEIVSNQSREVAHCPDPYSPYKDEAQRKRVHEFSNKIYDIFVSDGATVGEMRMSLSAVHDLIDLNAKAVPIELLG